MSRYMTPAKVGLLCLVKVYAEDNFTKAAVVPLLSLIMENLLPLEATLQSSGQKAGSTSTTLMSQAERALGKIPSKYANRSVYDLFLAEAWGLACLDSLDDFIENMSLLVEKTREELIFERDNQIQPDRSRRLGRNFPLGAFVRKAQLEYSKLQFQETAELFRGFQQLRLSTLQTMTNEQRKTLQGCLDVDILGVGPELSKKLSAVAFRHLESPSSEESVLNGIDFERLFEFQVSQMQSECTILWLNRRN